MLQSPCFQKNVVVICSMLLAVEQIRFEKQYMLLYCYQFQIKKLG